MDVNNLQTIKLMGFSNIDLENGKYHHVLTGDVIYDFSAASLLGTIKIVFETAKQIGREEVKNSIKDILEIHKYKDDRMI